MLGPLPPTGFWGPGKQGSDPAGKPSPSHTFQVDKNKDFKKILELSLTPLKKKSVLLPKVFKTKALRSLKSESQLCVP